MLTLKQIGECMHNIKMYSRIKGQTPRLHCGEKTIFADINGADVAVVAQKDNNFQYLGKFSLNDNKMSLDRNYLQVERFIDPKGQEMTFSVIVTNIVDNDLKEDVLYYTTL